MTRKGFWKTLVAGLVGSVGIGKGKSIEKKSDFPRICRYELTAPEFKYDLDAAKYCFYPEKRRRYFDGIAVVYSQKEYDNILEMLRNESALYGRWFVDAGYPQKGVATFLCYSVGEEELKRTLREFSFLRKDPLR